MNGSMKKYGMVLIGWVLALLLTLGLWPVSPAIAAETDADEDVVPSQADDDPAQEDDPPPRPPLPGDDDDDDDDGVPGRSGGRGSKARNGDPEIVGDVATLEARVGELILIPFVVNNYVGRSDEVVVTTKLPSFLSFERGTTSWGEFMSQGNDVTVDIGPLFKDDVVQINLVARVVEPVASPNNVIVANLTTTSSNDDPDNNTALIRLNVRLSGGVIPPAPGEQPVPGDVEGIYVVEGTEGVTANMALNSRPTANVTIEFITDEQLDPIPSLTFTPDNWNDIQLFLISAREDRTAEGRHSSIISFNVISDDPAYNGIELPGLTVVIDDNDQPGVIITL